MKKITCLLISLIFILGIEAQNIFTSIEANNMEEVKTILDKNPELLNEKDHANLTPLNRAAYFGKEEISM